MYRIRGLFGGDFNLVVWRIFIDTPNLKHAILNCGLSYFLYASLGMALRKFFKQQEKPSKGNLLSRKQVESADKDVARALESSTASKRTVAKRKI